MDVKMMSELSVYVMMFVHLTEKHVSNKVLSHRSHIWSYP